ncbi:flavin reductase family protein [Subtercola boreus]|uniref:Flavin reductase domain-containing protein n=1 Tax=Subtercola boreus TaxID=120213 RepID=A0A3E0WF15_9MICO|nr:flavin reductase family protein [Subtercola boreus]RFA18737.1 flavin reductase domain-containing protein [Subtercola boreus]RFA22353.1 flavin reductase domain-containing protein [Subtercola boreus]RFA28330.1 flavin reductase domain-containing protein [Subtercola boreus]
MSFDIDFGELGEYERYKLMASLIVPRPIAFVTTVDAGGVTNAAPFSMFCMLGEEPPLLLISLNKVTGGGQKDTAQNIDLNGEFVVHMVDEELAHAADRSSESLPYGTSELEHLGLSTTESKLVSPPTIVAAPVAFECVLHEKLETTSREIFIGRIVSLHTRDDLIDTNTWRVRLANYFPVARFGASFYTTTRDRFALPQGDTSPAVLSTVIDEL